MIFIKDALLEPKKSYRCHFEKKCIDIPYTITNVDVYDIDLALGYAFTPFVPSTGFRLTRHLVKFDYSGFAYYFNLKYHDDCVDFNLFFKCLDDVFLFLEHYKNDYDIIDPLLSVYSDDDFLILSLHDCLQSICRSSFGKSPDVPDVVVDSEQRGLLDDELPF